MTWEEIMEIKNPNEALKQIVEKVIVEDLSLLEQAERTREYERLHDVDSYEMALDPNGESVITLELFWEFEKKRETLMKKCKKDNDD